MIEIQDLTVRYSEQIPVFDALNLTVRDGESIAVIGANGAGKSTLLLSLVGLAPIQSGTIRIDALPLEKKHLQAIRAKVGLVFQNPDDQLFMPTVLEDVLFGPLNYGIAMQEAKQAAEELLCSMNIAHLSARAPQDLSGGEKRIVALATVLAMNPDVLLLDEPSSFLDPGARRTMIKLIKPLPQTKLLATHDLDLALDLSDRVILLLKGRIEADGPADTVLRDRTLLERCGLELPYRLQGNNEST